MLVHECGFFLLALGDTSDTRTTRGRCVLDPIDPRCDVAAAHANKLAAGDLTTGILVDTVQADDGIKPQVRLDLGDGLVEVCAVSLEIEPHGGRGDHLHAEIGERQYYIV